MKKLLIFSLLSILVLPIAFAIEVNIEEQYSSEVAIPEINKPATFNLKVTNLGSGTDIEFYNLVGFNMFPKGNINFGGGETKDIELKVYPREDFDYNGFYTFKYHIRSIDGTEITRNLRIEVIDLKDSFEIGAGEIHPESNSIDVYIHNRESVTYDNAYVRFSSAFFESEEDFSLGPNERKDFTIKINKEDFKKLLAGFYTLNAEITVANATAGLEETIKFVEKDILTTTSQDFGLIVNTNVIKKTNEGNIETYTETVIKKNIISRLFTTFSPEPDAVDRQNFAVYYTWSRDIPPGESLSIVVKTNWLFPFLIVLLLVIIVVLAQQYKKTDLVLRKRVSFVKAKGGEFALKVSLIINARNHVERVNIIDKLPNLVKVYEKFGSETPKKVDEKLKKIEWEFDVLEKGETRVVNYIVYSKVGVVGRFALPGATGIYEINGKIHETQSNRAFFIAEQGRTDIDEE